MSGAVDHEQAAELAASQLDADLEARCRALGTELDELHERVLRVAGPLTETLNELIDREDLIGQRGPDILLGRDRTVTYETLVRARRLYCAWSGGAALRARMFRLCNLLNDVAGLDQAVIDPARIERDLAEERGR